MSESEGVSYYPEEVYSWLKPATSLAILLSLYPLLTGFVAYISAFFLFFKKLPKMVVDGTFVDRPGLEALLLAAVDHRDSYTVLVYGDRGGGKTSLIQHAFSGHRGVVNVVIDKVDHDAATDQLTEQLSQELHFLNFPQRDHFIKTVFSRCGPVKKPIVVVSIEDKCPGPVLDAVVTLAKGLSYEQRYRKHPRIVIDISGSRAAIEAGTSLENRRVVGIHVGNFLKDEAEEFVGSRIPKCLEDSQRSMLSTLIVNKFDLHVLKLQKVCARIVGEQATQKSQWDSIIDSQFTEYQRAAMQGWNSFCGNLETMLDFKFERSHKTEIAKLLLQGSLQTQAIINKIEELDKLEPKRTVTMKDIGLANADTAYHPLFVDPFRTDISLAGKAVAEALREEYQLEA